MKRSMALDQMGRDGERRRKSCFDVAKKGFELKKRSTSRRVEVEVVEVAESRY
jgi:hypothetical protein